MHKSFQESVYHLFWLTRSIEYNFNTIIEASKPEHSQIAHRVRAVAHSMILIQVKALFDEIDVTASYKQKEINQTFKPFKESTDPIIKGIRRKWKDIERFRNNILAHNLRNRDGDGVLINLHSYQVPNSIDDLSVLYQLIILYKSQIELYFLAEVGEYENWLDANEKGGKYYAFENKEQRSQFILNIYNEVEKLRKK